MSQSSAATPAQQEDNGFRCLICQHHRTVSPFDACEGCKARMFTEYLSVKGGL